MKLGALISGGKDSLYSAYLAKKAGHEISCFMTICSKNKDSYMFHTPNIHLTELQSKAAGIPIIMEETEGIKEKELENLKQLLQKAKEKYKIDGITTGAVASVYQSSRIQKICLELELWCFNPLWQINQEKLLQELLENKFEIIISSVAAYPFDEAWLGKKIDRKTVSELLEMNKKNSISPAGEGGEFESFVVSCPLFKNKIKIRKASKEFNNYAGIYKIEDAELI